MHVFRRYFKAHIVDSCLACAVELQKLNLLRPIYLTTFPLSSIKRKTSFYCQTLTHHMRVYQEEILWKKLERIWTTSMLTNS